jgi:hypothetical protein
MERTGIGGSHADRPRTLQRLCLEDCSGPVPREVGGTPRLVSGESRDEGHERTPAQVGWEFGERLRGVGAERLKIGEVEPAGFAPALDVPLGDQPIGIGQREGDQSGGCPADDDPRELAAEAAEETCGEGE